MAKCVIIGVDVVESYTNKKTGKPDSAIILQMVQKSSKCYGGCKVRDPFISQSSSIFKVFESFAEDPDSLVGYVCDAEFNGNFLNEIELLEKLDHNLINW